MGRLTYSHLKSLETFEDRFEYLRLKGEVGSATFGSARYINQDFYRSREWKDIRRDVILRDNGCDLGIQTRPIQGRVIIHHLNPITEDNLAHADLCLYDLENLICVSFVTHNAIHYGDSSLLFPEPFERTPFDTCPWKGGRL